jgi:putative Holliday junction resolvase
VKVVGLDLGARRIGVAVSDSAGVVAVARCTISRSGDREDDERRILAVVEEASAGVVVVGLPLGLDGLSGKAAEAALSEARRLSEVLAPKGVEVQTFDERFTTVSAERGLAEAGVRRKVRRKVVDQAAAAVMLQAWLDRRRADRQAPETGA